MGSSVVVNTCHAGSIECHGSVECAVAVKFRLGNHSLMVVMACMTCIHGVGGCQAAVATFDEYFDSVSKFVESLSDDSKI